MRVVIAEDSVLLREGLSRLLAEHGVDVVATCSRAEDLLLQVQGHTPDVAIVDIRLPPTHSDEGLRAALQIRAQHPSGAVLVLSQYVEVGAMRLLADSAEGAGYLLKDRISDVAEFVGALQRGGGRRLRGRPDHRVHAAGQTARRRPAGGAHPTRARGARADGRGPLHQGIADKLVLSLRPVEKYVSSIFTKLDLPSGASESRRVLAVLLHLRF